MNRSEFEFRTIVIMSAFVSLCAVRMSAVEIVNSGFETPAFTPGDWLKISAESDPTDGLVGGWTFFNNSGIGNNGSPWVNTAPEGVQVGYVKDDSSIEQDFEITSLGSYRLNFLAAHRPNYPATHLRVLIDDLEVAYWASSEIMDNEQFATYSVYLGFLPQGTHTLTFEGIKPGADSATAFDDVRIEIEVEAYYWNPAPLSSNWNATVWSLINGDPGTLSWGPGSIAVFNQPSAYTVSIDTSQSAETLYVDAGDVTFDGVATVSFADMRIASGATLSGAGERYLKVGDTQLILDGTLEVSSLTDPGRTLELVSGTGSLVLAADIAVSGRPYFSGSVSGSGGLTKIGADELRVDNSFTGAATVESGFLVLKNALAGSVSVAADAGVAFETPAALVAALNDSGNNFANGSMAGLYNAATLVNPDLSAADFGSVRFLKLGAGVLEINNATALSEATNGVVIAGGNFLYKNASAIPVGTPITVRNGAILSFNYSALMTIDHPLTLSGNYDETDSKGSLFMQWGNSTVDINAPITLADDTKIQAYASQETVNFNAPIIGTGNLIIEGDGAANDHLKIFNFNVPFTYEGNTILRNEGGSSAEFYWGADNILPTNYVLRVSGENVNHYTHLDFKGFSQQIAGLNNGELNYSARMITNSAATTSVLTIDVAANRSYSFSGAFAGEIRIVKDGPGSQNLSDGDGSMRSGDVQVRRGTLLLDESYLLKGGTVEVLRDARLALRDAEGIEPSTAQTILYAGVDKSTHGDSPVIEIPDGVNVTVRHFAIEGVFKSSGTWGTAISGAEHIDNTVFYGGGTLTVLETGPLSATIMLIQ